MKFVEISFLYFILCILALRSVASSLEYDRIGQKRHFSSAIHTQTSPHIFTRSPPHSHSHSILHSTIK